MIAKSKPDKRLIPAAAYIRQSSDKQDKSPDQQRAEMTKLAEREGLTIPDTLWFTDEVSGDNGVDRRPGFGRMLAAAERGKFKTLLCWHSNRLSREDPMEGIGHYNRLRKAGVRVLSACEGWIDPAKFTDQLLLLVKGRESNEYLVELAAKVVRGQAENARAGWWNGSTAPFGFSRAEFSPDKKLVRRLNKGEVKAKGNRVGLVVCPVRLY